MAEPVDGRPSYDPAFLRARREAAWILLAWAACLVWTVGYSAWAGYAVPPEAVTLTFGMPSWVFWGVAFPWVAATAFSVWFGLRYLADDDVQQP